MLKYILIPLSAMIALPAAYSKDNTYTLPEDKPFNDEWRYSGAVRSGDTIYLSGVVAGLRQDETDYEPAFERAFAQVGKTLSLAGAGWEDVVDMTTYHTDIAAQMTSFRKIKDKYVSEPWPAWTAIGVTRLVPPNGLVEIKIVARVKAR